MNAVLVAVLLVIPAHLDLPPEIDVAAVASATAVRLDPPAAVETTTALPGSSADEVDDQGTT